MNKQKLPSLLWGSMIIAGTAIGAGMLANPTSMSGIWFLGSVVMLLFTWFSTGVGEFASLIVGAILIGKLGQRIDLTK